MKVSKKAYYGLRAAIRLSQSTRPISAHELSRLEDIPEDFLEKILQKLRVSGVVESKKGTDGGYALAQPPSKISVWNVLEPLDGPIRTIGPNIKNGTLPCSIVSHCQTNEVWRTLEKEIESTLSKITLHHLIKPKH